MNIEISKEFPKNKVVLYWVFIIQAPIVFLASNSHSFFGWVLGFSAFAIGFVAAINRFLFSKYILLNFLAGLFMAFYGYALGKVFYGYASKLFI